MTTTMKMDAIYARYSSRKQDDSTSIDVQLEACRRGAGGPCVEYVDRAKTGRTTGGREALLRLMDDAAAGKIGRLFVYKFDRLGRAAETHTVVADLEEHGVEVISTTEGKETLARGVQLVVAEHYSRALAERTRAGLVKRHEQQAWTGGEPPYGFQIVRDAINMPRVVVEPVEAETVRWLFGTFLAESVGVKLLARRLQERAVPTRRGAPWSFTTVRAILVNRMYTGEVRYGVRKMKLDRKTGRRRPRFNPKQEHKVYLDPALAIIEPADFERAQQKIAERARPGSGHRSGRGTYAFTGFLFCGSCGSVYYSRLSQNGKGTYRYYNCGCRQARGRGACPNSATVREDQLIAQVGQACASLFDDAESLVEAALKEAEEAVSSRRGEAERVRAEVARLADENERLVRLLLDPDIDQGTKKVISRQIADAEAKREDLQEAVERLDVQATGQTEKMAGAVRRALAEARESLAAVAAPAELHRFVEDFVGPMIVQPDGTIAPRFPETQTASAGAEAVAIGNVAGGGFEPPTSGL